MSVPQGEQMMWANIANISRSLKIIANCMEAAENRARRLDEEKGNTLEGECFMPFCTNPPIMMLNGEKGCQEHIDELFAQMRPAIEAVQQGMADLEKAAREEGTS